MIFQSKPKLTLVALAALLSLLATPAMADGLSAQDIVDKSLERNKFGFQNAIAAITLKLVSKRGSERVREVEIKSIERDGLGKSLVRFNAPTDVARGALFFFAKDQIISYVAQSNKGIKVIFLSVHSDESSHIFR